MFCAKCGAPLNDDDLFCGECGFKVGDELPSGVPVNTPSENETEMFDPYKQPVQPVQPVESVQPVEPVQPVESVQPVNPPKPPQSKNIDIKVSKKGAKIAIIVVVIVAILATALGVGLKVLATHKLRQPIVFDLTEYISETVVDDKACDDFWDSYEGYDSSDEAYGEDYYDDGEIYDFVYINSPMGANLHICGYDTYAYINSYDLYNAVDWNRIIEDFNKQICEKKGYEDKSFMDFVTPDQFEFAIDKQEKIQNGDTVKLTVSTLNEEYKIHDVTVKLTAGEKSYKIDGLKKVNGINPFDYIQLVLEGANGSGEASIEIKNKLNKKIEGVSGYSVKEYDYDTVAVYKGDYIIAKLDYYIMDKRTDYSNGDTITVGCSSDDAYKLENDHSIILVKTSQDYSVNILGDYIKADFKFLSDDLGEFKNHALAEIKDDIYSDSYKNIKFYGAYLGDNKDTTESSYIKNVLVVVYSYDYEFYDKTTEPGYFAVYYYDLIGKDGKISYYPDYYYDYDIDHDFDLSIITDNERFNYNKL